MNSMWTTEWTYKISITSWEVEVELESEFEKGPLGKEKEFIKEENRYFVVREQKDVIDWKGRVTVNY